MKTLSYKDFEKALRKPADSVEVQAILSALGVTKPPKMPRDDIEARVSLPKNGLNLIFQPEASKKSLVLTAFLLFSDSEKSYSSFAGELPSGLAFADTRKEVAEKLGKPIKSDEVLRWDKWKNKDNILKVKYAKEYGRVEVISIFAQEFYT